MESESCKSKHTAHSKTEFKTLTLGSVIKKRTCVTLYMVYCASIQVFNQLIRGRELNRQLSRPLWGHILTHLFGNVSEGQLSLIAWQVTFPSASYAFVWLFALFISVHMHIASLCASIFVYRPGGICFSFLSLNENTVFSFESESHLCWMATFICLVLISV